MKQLIHTDYYIKNTTGEFSSAITKRALHKETIMELLETSYDWYRTQPSGTVFERNIYVDTETDIISEESKIIYEKR